MATGEEDYNFLQYGQYPADYNKNQKRNFRRKALNNYEVKKGLLYYHQNGSKVSKQVPRSSKDKQRIVNACHSSAEG